MDHTCICEEFMLPNQAISTFSNVPKKKPPGKEETADLLVKEGKIIHDEKKQEKFFKQYGIIRLGFRRSFF
jgi:hypothetical protein